MRMPLTKVIKSRTVNITALSGVPSGVLFKSARTRGGFARDIRIHDLTLGGVAIPIHITLNWNPSYSHATLPAGAQNVPPYWVALTTKSTLRSTTSASIISTSRRRREPSPTQSTDNIIKTADGSKPVSTDSTVNDSRDVPYGEPK